MEHAALETMPSKKQALEILERSYEENPYPKSADYQLLKAVTGMELKDIRKWFAMARVACRNKGTLGSLIEYRTYRRLETSYKNKHNPSRKEMEEIASQLSLNFDEVAQFFAKKWHIKSIDETNVTLESTSEVVEEPDTVVYI